MKQTVITNDFENFIARSVLARGNNKRLEVRVNLKTSSIFYVVVTPDAEKIYGMMEHAIAKYNKL